LAIVGIIVAEFVITIAIGTVVDTVKIIVSLKVAADHSTVSSQ